MSDLSPGGHLDLMELIGSPLPPSVSLTSGYEGFQAFNFQPEANIGRHTKTFVPGSFYRDFAIIVTVSYNNCTTSTTNCKWCAFFLKAPFLMYTVYMKSHYAATLWNFENADVTKYIHHPLNCMHPFLCVFMLKL